LKRASYLKRTSAGTLFDIINVILMILLIIIMLYPFWNQFVYSISDGIDAQKGSLYLWPRIFSMANYKYIFKSSGITKSALMSLARVLVGTTTKLLFTGLLAYVTTVKFFPFHRHLRRLFVVSMYISAGMIAYYLWMLKLGLLESFTIYWLPGLLGPYEMMIIAAYIQSLPDALSESARLDGARETSIYFRIIFPLCKPVFAALAIMVAVGHWNSWFDVLIYNPSGKFNTLQIELRKILIESEQIRKLLSDISVGSSEAKSAASRVSTVSMRAATTMIVTIPIVCVYPFFQKYFIKGISVGAVKE